MFMGSGPGPLGHPGMTYECEGIALEPAFLPLRYANNDADIGCDASAGSSDADS
jgi:hypothetical protein